MTINYENPNNFFNSSSKSVNETLNGSHNFTIRGYSLIKGMGPGNYIASDTFNVGGYEWVIYFYPDGKNPDDSSTYVSVFIALASDGIDVRALFELTLMDQSGEGRHKVHSHFERILESGPYTLNYRGSMWGYKRFFRRTSLETSNFLKDDCLSMHCTVGVVRTRVEAPKLYSVPVPPSDMGDSLKYLLDAELGCDIVFQVGDETFKAHKLILAARSSVFRAHFFGVLGSTNSDKIELEDIVPCIFKALLQFIYSDSLPNVYEIIGSTFMTTFAIMMQHLLAAADRFGLDRLKQLCEAKLCEEVSVDTVANILCIAEQHRCPQLKAICLKFAATNLRVVMQSEGFIHLRQICPSLLSELLDAALSVGDKSNHLLALLGNNNNNNNNNNKKRSGSSILGLDADCGAGGVAESVNPNSRRLHPRRL